MGLAGVVIAGSAFSRTSVRPVAGGPALADAPRAVLPLVIYSDKDDRAGSYIPSGWMGNMTSLEYDDASTEQPHGGVTCIRISYVSTGSWAGLVWQDPANDWGDEPGGYDLTGAKTLTFWARGQKGGEKVEFKLGILGRKTRYPDSASATLGTVRLTSKWKQYAIRIGTKNLSCLKTPFGFVVPGDKKPVTFYLDEIQFE
jgi:hypothetical protein